MTEPDEQAARRARADRATRGGLAAVLGLEAVVTLLVPRALAFSDGGLGATKTVLLIALAVVMVAAAGLVRRPWGIGFGSLVQLLFLLSGLWLLPLLVVAALFAAVWGRLLWLRHELLATPTGWRLLSS
ncbi:MAG TPA: DUF4233 domain-containing protein [Jatrophihabitans sp.]|jgi:hypothetical protein